MLRQGLINNILHNTNLPKLLCKHLFGHKHTHRHRMVVGVGVMVVGVAVAKFSTHLDIYYIHFAGDVFGYAMHGLGATPFIEYFIALGATVE